MYNNQYVISIGNHKKVIYAKILSETNYISCVTSMANTHTNRCLADENDVYKLKNNRYCTMHMYKVKNHKYKTIHKCLIYNFTNTQDRLTFMDNLVKFVANRKFPNLPKLKIFELTRTKMKDKQSITLRKLRENPKAVISPRDKVYCKKKKCIAEDKPGKSQLHYSSNSNTSWTTTENNTSTTGPKDVSKLDYEEIFVRFQAKKKVIRFAKESDNNTNETNNLKHYQERYIV